MDLADATLVALAERLNTNKVFSTDQHFRVYKIRDREPFNVVP
jgi:predicted nucleic acid-binding protein